MKKHVADVSELLFMVEPGFTTIVREEGNVYIDYEAGKLYRLDAGSGKCVQYPLTIPKAGFISERIKLFEEIQVLNTGGKPQGSKQEQHFVSLVFGPRAMLFRGAKSPVFEQYSQQFTPGRVNYLIDPAYDRSSKILEIAENNKNYYQKYPLLSQLDILGLMPFLKGIPVQMEKLGVTTDIRYQISEKGSQRRKLPRNCQAFLD